VIDATCESVLCTLASSSIAAVSLAFPLPLEVGGGVEPQAFEEAVVRGLSGTRGVLRLEDVSTETCGLGFVVVCSPHPPDILEIDAADADFSSFFDAPHPSEVDGDAPQPPVSVEEDVGLPQPSVSDTEVAGFPQPPGEDAFVEFPQPPPSDEFVVVV
jgi:hypothetical protein